MVCGSHLIIRQLLIAEAGKPEYGIECVCEITADLSNLRSALVEKVSREHGGKYWLLDYNVVIEFGDTELHAYLEWTENVSPFFVA